VNKYLFAGLGGLALIAVALLLLLNNVLMPNYTRATEAFPMPNVESLSQEAAIETLRAHNIESITWDSVLNRSQARGTILLQHPRPNAQIKPGRTVYLQRAHHLRDTARVPQLVNEERERARGLVYLAGLVVREELPDPSPTPFPNVITRQFPPADSTVLKGDSVTFWYGIGLGNRLVEVPNLVGLSMADAERFLRAAGLYGQRVDGSDTTAVVSGQGPAAGASVQEGSMITFW